jgi:hypothetical protein
MSLNECGCAAWTYRPNWLEAKNVSIETIYMPDPKKRFGLFIIDFLRRTSVSVSSSLCTVQMVVSVCACNFFVCVCECGGREEGGGGGILFPEYLRTRLELIEYLCLYLVH